MQKKIMDFISSMGGIMQTLYGIINQEGVYLNFEYPSLKGAKIGASRRGYTQVGRRVGYNIVHIWTKIDNIWTEAGE